MDAATIQRLVADLYARFPDLPQQALVRALDLITPLRRGRGWGAEELRDLVAAWQECHRDVPEELGDALWEIYLREAVLKALAQNPDSEIIRHIETYCRANDRTFRIPFATDKLTDTARISLERARLRVRDSA